jgi:hypothetical protein
VREKEKERERERERERESESERARILGGRLLFDSLVLTIYARLSIVWTVVSFAQHSRRVQ